jgi:hypothetical protein
MKHYKKYCATTHTNGDGLEIVTNKDFTLRNSDLSIEEGFLAIKIKSPIDGSVDRVKTTYNLNLSDIQIKEIK